MTNEKLYAVFQRRHALGYLNFPSERKTWGEILAELGLERGSWLETPAGYVDIDDPGDRLGGLFNAVRSPRDWDCDKIRMTEDFAMRVLTLGLP